MTHVFVVDKNTIRYHLEYLFAGTGAKDKLSPFLVNSSTNYPSTTERMLVGMIADISRIRIGDKVVFYLQSANGNPGMFFGVFKVISKPFFDESDSDNYLINSTNKGLSFRVLLGADEVFAKGVTEHEYLDSLEGKDSPCDLCWSLIYRKLKGNRGCTMIMDYEFDDLLNKLRAKNGNKVLSGNAFTFDESIYEISCSDEVRAYLGRKNSLKILPRLLYKAERGNAFESHLQAHIMQNFDSNLYNDLIPINGCSVWIGNEVSCGVGMQRIDIMIKQETKNDVYIRLIELKDESPYFEIITNQLPWYIEWLSYYVLPKYSKKSVHVIPTIIGKGQIPDSILSEYKKFAYPIPKVDVTKLEYFGFETTSETINFTKYL